MRPPVSLSLIALCGGVGFFASYALTSAPASAPHVGANTATASPASRLSATIDGALEGSSMAAEWERLKATEGGGNDFAGLYARIKETEDRFRRRAFLAAAMADWAVRDPKNALLSLRKEDNYIAVQFVYEWLRTNPNAAIDQLLSDNSSESRYEIANLLEEIARLAPGRLAEICAKSVTPLVMHGPGRPPEALNPEEAFSVLAGRDLAAARAAAETLSGTMRTQAMAGIGGAWAEKDGVAALAWAESLPPGAEREAVLQRVLTSWAKTDPLAALGKLDLVPKTGPSEGNSQNTAPTEVLAAAARKDWYGTMTWLKANPEKFGDDAFLGLHNAFSRRLRDDPIPMMRDVLAGNLPVLTNVFAYAITGEGYAQRETIWAWLQDQPKSPTTDTLRGSLLNVVAYKEPAVALDLVRSLPDSEENRELFSNVAASMFNNGGTGHLDEWYDKASPAMRPYLLRHGLKSDSQSVGAYAARWVERLAEMPADMRHEVVPALAGGWATNDPAAAGQWALSLTDPNERARAFTTVGGIWAVNDNEQFATMVESLPQGVDRDLGTKTLAQSLMQNHPEAAWDWAAQIQEEGSRLQMLKMVYSTYAARNRAAADELLSSANLSEEQFKRFQQIQSPKQSKPARGRRTSH